MGTGILSEKLDLERCPHCGVNRPNLTRTTHCVTRDHRNGNSRTWGFYCCANCGGVVSAWAKDMNQPVLKYFPELTTVDETVPERPREFLRQAIDGVHIPAGSVMCSASAVDAMLKINGYTEGSLYERIEKAAQDHLITQEMAKWAHAVRLDANEQRHAEESAPLPTEEDAKRSVEFVQALAQFLFVLPERVKHGIEKAEETKTKK